MGLGTTPHDPSSPEQLADFPQLDCGHFSSHTHTLGQGDSPRPGPLLLLFFLHA